MLRPASHIRYHIAAILATDWIQFVLQYKRWIQPSGPVKWSSGMMGLIGMQSNFLTQHSTIPEFHYSM